MLKCGWRTRVCVRARVWEGTKELMQAELADSVFFFVRRPRVWITREVTDASIIAVMQHSEEERRHPRSSLPLCLSVLMQHQNNDDDDDDGDRKEER